MIICPDCGGGISVATYSCNQCNWQALVRGDYQCLFSSADKANHTFNRYLENYDKICEDDLSESIQHPDYLKLQNEKFFSYIGNAENKDICELGVGQGIVLDKILTNNPKSVTGIDISIGYLEKIRAKYPTNASLNLLVANAENLPFRDHFDVVVAADIMEHVLNVGDFLYSARRALKPNGKMILKVPYLEDLNQYSRLNGCKYEFVHLRNFSTTSLRLIIERAGFRVKKFHYDGFHPALPKNYIKKSPILTKWFNKKIIAKYKVPEQVTGINNALGSILMQPLEITAVAEVIK